MNPDQPLRLIALEVEDLDVLAAHLQDAVVKVGDITRHGRSNRVLLVVNRFAWEAGPIGRGRAKTWQRRRSVLRFDRVTAVRSTGIDRAAPDTVLSILTLQFVPGESPAGKIEIVFSGGAAIEMDVECIEAQITDLGAAWATPHRPRHGTG